MRATCPNCQHEFEFKRRPMGSGTVIDRDAPLTFTESQVFQSVNDTPSTVRDVQNRMMDENIRKNYHQVQAALSTLVYRGLVQMNVSMFPPTYLKP